MGDLIEDLNYDCNYNIFLCKSILSGLPSVADRQKVIRWMRKLLTCNRSIEEMRLRNEFLYVLVLNVQNGELQPPFTENPGPGPLSSQLLPIAPATTPDMDNKIINEMNAAKPPKPMIYQNSPDGGAFLAAQPVPRCGAFCYLAVVSRSDKTSGGSPENSLLAQQISQLLPEDMQDFNNSRRSSKPLGGGSSQGQKPPMVRFSEKSNARSPTRPKSPTKAPPPKAPPAADNTDANKE